MLFCQLCAHKISTASVASTVCGLYSVQLAQLYKKWLFHGAIQEVTLFCREFEYWRIYAFFVLVFWVKNVLVLFSTLFPCMHKNINKIFFVQWRSVRVTSTEVLVTLHLSPTDLNPLMASKLPLPAFPLLCDASKCVGALGLEYIAIGKAMYCRKQNVKQKCAP